MFLIWFIKTSFYITEECLLITRIVSLDVVQWHGTQWKREYKNHLKIGKYPITHGFHDRLFKQ